jgi:hypothetical protein
MNADCKTNLNHKGHEGTQRKNKQRLLPQTSERNTEERKQHPV